MTPAKGQRVKCFMRSGMVLEGTVEEWGGAQIVLKSNDQNIVIIHRPLDDIMLTKVILQEPPQEKIKAPSEMKEQIRGKLHEVLQGADPDLETKNIQQLREMVVEQDRQIIAGKRREHFGSPGVAKQAIQYTNPFTTKK